MNDDVIADLKQFIAATVSQQTAQLEQVMDERFAEVDKRFEKIDEQFARVDERFAGIETKIDDLSSSIAEAIDVSNETTGQQLKDHESRIARLEHKAA